MNGSHLTNEQLIDYVHGELGPEEDAGVHEHLLSCSICSHAHQAELALGDLLRSQARAEELELPPGFTTALYARIAAGEPPARSWFAGLSALLRPAIAIPVAAALVLAAYFGISNVRTGGAGGLQASYFIEHHTALAATAPLEDGASVPVTFTSDTTSDADDTAAR